MANPDPPAAEPAVQFLYTRDQQQVHFALRGLTQSELLLLMTALWLDREPAAQAAFVDALQRYLDGDEAPPPLAVGLAEMLHRGRTGAPPNSTLGPESRN